MKTLMIIASILIAGTAMAGEYTDYGRITFQKASTWVPANKVCSQGGFLYHKTKEFVAVDYCDDDNNNCKTVYKALVQPVNSTRQRCSKMEDDECVAWTTVSFVQGTVKADVYESMSALHDDEAPKSSFSYTVDACNL